MPERGPVDGSRPEPGVEAGGAPRDGGPAIETRSLTKTYDETVGVADVSLAVASGEVYGFLGPNGAGKTTTIRLLAGLIRPTEGEAEVAGASIADRDELAGRVGFAPSTPPVYEELTGREQLALVAELFDLDPVVAEARIGDLLARFELTDDADQYVASYSGGMRRKVAIAQAVLPRPPVVLLDEPTAGLDPRAVDRLVDLLEELRAGGTTVFLSSHVVPFVESIADRVGVLHRGRLIAQGDPADLPRRVQSEGGTLADAFLRLTDEGSGADR